MVWIEAVGSAEIFVHAAPDEAHRLILDVPKSGTFFPRVATVEDRGDGVYRFRLEPRRTLGSEFTADYITRYYPESPRVVRWETVEGNLRVRGRWLITETAGGVRLRVEVTTGLEAPVPRFLKKPATLFAQRETRQGLDAQLARFKAELERPRPPTVHAGQHPA